MKKYLLLLLAVFFVILQNSNAQSPIAYYPFNGNANDVIGSLNGTVNGATLATDRFGNPNSAYSFDGVDDRLFASIATTVTDNFSLSGWIKVNSIGNPVQMIMFNGNSFANGWGLIVNATGNLSVVYGAVTNTPTPFVLSINQWYHVALVRSFGNTIVYVNSIPVFNGVIGTPATPSGNFSIGNMNTGTDFFNGSIDEVKIYNTALSASQVSAEFIASSLIANYQLNGNVNDASGNNLNGTLTGVLTSTADRFGNNENALSFNGSTRIDVTDNPLLRPTNVTLSAWVYYNSSSGTKMIASKNLCGGTGESFGIFIFNGTIGGAWSDGPSTNSISAAAPVVSQWHLVTFTFDDANNLASLYLDGVLAASQASTLSLGYDNSSFSIGSELESCVNSFFYDGAIDDVKIYNVALTATQIATEYATGNQAQKPGSGNAINFDGVDDVITVPNSANLQFPGDLTVDFWVKIPQTQNNTANPDNSIMEKWAANNGAVGYPFVFRYIRSSGIVVFNRYDGSTGASIGSITAIGNDKWHHIAATKSGSLLSLYVDGVLESTGTDLSNLSNVNNADNLSIGSRGLLAVQPNNLTGSVDEVRIWNTGLTQTQIRDRMCHKITSTDALYSNLAAYYNFDEGAVINVFDGTVNINNGTLINGPTRSTSGAAIGNASAHDYVNATKTASIVHASGESFTVTSSTGTPEGIQVYRVDELPNSLTGTQGVGTNDKYFGVFQVGGSSPTYQAVYDYTGNTGINAGNENTLALYKRNDNAVTSWVNAVAVLNTTANTLTVAGQSTEYLLGSTGFALPVNLISFTGTKQNNDALLQWKTANEINLSHFEIQRSENGQNFIPVGTVSSGGSPYAFTDVNIFNSKAVVFYRLKSIDIDGRFTTSAIIRLSNKQINLLTVYPNPAKNIITISSSKKQDALIINAAGMVTCRLQLINGSFTMDVSSWAGGIYFIKTEDELIKLIKQ